MKHYGKFLAWAGNPVKYQSADIETLFMKRERLERELQNLNALIEEKEREFSEFIAGNWTAEEIQEAKDKASKT